MAAEPTEGFFPITSHSLSSRPWLPRCPSKLKLSKVPLVPTEERREEMREKTDTFCKSFDVDDVLAMTDDEDEEDGMARMLRRMQEQSDHELGARRDAFEKAATKHILSCFKEDRALRAGFAYEIEVRVKSVRPWIRRRFVVPAGMTLHSFADRVLIVAFGYSRGEHTYICYLPSAAYPGRMRPRFREDVCFIDTHAHTIDKMHIHMFRGGYCCVPAQDVLLCDVLREGGDTITCEYDLGDRISHQITLLGPRPQSEGGRRVTLISGA